SAATGYCDVDRGRISGVEVGTGARVLTLDITGRNAVVPFRDRAEDQAVLADIADRVRLYVTMKVRDRVVAFRLDEIDGLTIGLQALGDDASKGSGARPLRDRTDPEALPIKIRAGIAVGHTGHVAQARGRGSRYRRLVGGIDGRPVRNQIPVVDDRVRERAPLALMADVEDRCPYLEI